MVAPLPVPIILVSMVVLGSLVFVPLFAASCAWVAQWRWRRRVARFEKKGLLVGTIPEPAPTPPLVVLGVAAGILLSLLSHLYSQDREPDLTTAALHGMSLLVLLGTLVASLRLAFTGMPPEPNFVLMDDSQRVIGHPRLPAKTTTPGPDLLDAREL